MVVTKRLGELLLERGVIAMEELQTCLEECHRTGGRLGTQLLRFGFVDERALLEALSQQYGVEFVPERLLLRRAPMIAGAIPAEVARRLQAVPFEESRGRLHVAMINPRDPAAIEELTAFGGRPVEPYVATEKAVSAALGEIASEVDELDLEPAFEPSETSWEEGWEALWTPPRVSGADLLAPLQREGEIARSALVATFPGLVPLVDLAGEGPEPVLDEETFVRRLQEVRHRDEVGDLLLRFAARLLGRVCLFAVHKGRAVGWMARGQAVVVDDVQSLEIPLDRPSVLDSVGAGGAPFIGSISGGEHNQALVRTLGDPAPQEVVVVPVGIKKRLVAILLGDEPGEPTVAAPVAELAQAATRAGIAFEILILRNKI